MPLSAAGWSTALVSGLVLTALPGAALPGVIIAGSYGLGAQRTFWDTRGARHRRSGKAS